MAEAIPPTTETPSPPYIPWRTFLNLLDKMREGVPSRLDASWLSSQAGGMHQPIQSAFRFFVLTSADNRPLPALEQLAKADDRRGHVATLLQAHYPWAFELGENATHGQLQETFRAHGLTGSTQTKGIRFFLAAASFAGIKVSRHFKAPREAGGTSSTTKAGSTGKRRRTRQSAPSTTPPSVQPPSTSASHRDAYIALLLKKAEAAEGDEAASLFDRIEKLLGEGGGAS